MSDAENETPHGARGGAARFFFAAPALLLSVVALHQLFLHRTADLSPWKGGGFGMFSSTDSGWTRHTHLFVTEPTGEVEVDLPDELDDLEDRLRALPTEDRFEHFARELSAEIGTEHPRHTGIRIELWRSHFDPVDLKPGIERMREYRFQASRDDAG